jgi:hypothetical protein
LVRGAADLAHQSPTVEGVSFQQLTAKTKIAIVPKPVGIDPVSLLISGDFKALNNTEQGCHRQDKPGTDGGNLKVLDIPAVGWVI